MKEKDFIKTSRLLLVPMTDSELQDRVYNARTAEEKKKYLEMLTGCQIYPTVRLWHTTWHITHRKTGALLGSIGFRGHPNEKGEVEIDYEIFPAHQLQGYGTEAMEAMIKWAFDRDGAYFIQAETQPYNTATRAMLEKHGFQPTGAHGERGLCYELQRPPETTIRDFLSLGATMGVFAGAMMGHLNAGILIGAFAGWCIGAYLDANDRRNRENIKKMRK